MSDDARSTVLARIAQPVGGAAELVNYATIQPPPPGPRPRGWRARWRWRKARRRARRKARTPGGSRVDFTAWATLPWRDRPREARLADVAHQIAEEIERCPAWGHPLLETHRLQFRPTQEAAAIAVNAYQVFLLRSELGEHPMPGGTPHDAEAGAQQAWDALVDRVATLEAFSEHLAQITPLVQAWNVAGRRDELEAAGDVTGLYQAAASDELAADRTRELSAGLAGIESALRSGLAALDTDMRVVTTRNGGDAGSQR